MSDTPPGDDATRVIVVGGPTASGKSALAIDLAERFDGIVINADSMQVYRDLRVLTARPDEADEVRVQHRLFGVLDAGDVCSAARWRDLAMAEIETAHAAGKHAIVVGGTGLYLRALMCGLAEVPPIPEEVRRRARAMYAERGAEAVHTALAERDPRMAARLAPGDSQRVLRAWEVVEATGRSLADWQAAGNTGGGPWQFDVIVLQPPREALYAACDERLHTMIDEGALDEVRALDARAARGEVAADVPALKALGVPNLRAHLGGEMALDAAVAAAQQATRQFAKRQMTWFRNQFPAEPTPPLHRIIRLEEKYSFVLTEKILSKLS